MQAGGEVGPATKREKVSPLVDRVHFTVSMTQDAAREYFALHKIALLKSFATEIVKQVDEIEWPLLFEVPFQEKIVVNMYVIQKLMAVLGCGDRLSKQEARALNFKNTISHWFKVILVLPDVGMMIDDKDRKLGRPTTGTDTSSIGELISNIEIEVLEIPLNTLKVWLSKSGQALYSEMSQKSTRELFAFYQETLPNMVASQGDLGLSKENSEQEVQRIFDARHVSPVVQLMRFAYGITATDVSFTRRYTLRNVQQKSTVHPDLQIISSAHQNVALVEFKAPYLFTENNDIIQNTGRLLNPNNSNRKLLNQLLNYYLSSGQDQILLSDLEHSCFIKINPDIEKRADERNFLVKFEVFAIKNYHMRHETVHLFNNNVVESRAPLAIMLHRASSSESNINDAIIKKNPYSKLFVPKIDSAGPPSKSSDGQISTDPNEGSLTSSYLTEENSVTISGKLPFSEILSDPKRSGGFAKVIRISVQDYKEIFDKNFVKQQDEDCVILKLYNKEFLKQYLCYELCYETMDELDPTEIAEFENKAFRFTIPREIEVNQRIMAYNSTKSDEKDKIHAPELYGFGKIIYDAETSSEFDVYLAFKAIDDYKISHKSHLDEVERLIRNISHGDITFHNTGFHRDGYLYLMDFNRSTIVEDLYDAKDSLRRDLDKLSYMREWWEAIWERYANQ